MSESNVMPASELQSAIKAEIQNCEGSTNSQLSSERAENLDYYFGRPFGNEIDGRSSVVSTDVRDTIEWIMPSLIRIFCSGDRVVEFEPQGPEDVTMARLATDYVNFIWNRDNRGFLNFYTWFKDALLSKNGVLKIWWEEKRETRRERYVEEARARMKNVSRPHRDDVLRRLRDGDF